MAPPQAGSQRYDRPCVPESRIGDHGRVDAAQNPVGIA